jgi:AcrR family transcriptional regulator
VVIKYLGGDELNEPNKPVRTRMKAAERREAILDAAELTFARLGYRGAGMADIADASGVTQPMLYRHFASKQELFLEVLTHTVGQVLELWKGAPDLAAMGAAYAQLALSRPHVPRLRQMAMAESDEVIQAHMQKLFHAQLAVIREKVASAEAAGRLAPRATVEGVTWLFTAMGMLIDATVAVDLPEALGGGLEPAAKLFWEMISVDPYKQS